MPRAERKALIEALEQHRGSRVLTYITGDRAPTGAQIGDDAVRPIYDQLRSVGHVEKLDLFIYSRGGALEVPWRIASALRQASESWAILIPFRANSAATLLALGADEIVLGRHGELGPIDPILNIQRMVTTPGQPEGTPLQDTINVEDVMAFLRFVREQVGLTDQDALAASLAKLTERLDAVGLGSVFRTRSHIRDVAHRMLTSQKTPPSDRVMETIVETLAERVYAHGHAIGLGEAQDIGLRVITAPDEVETAMWNLLEAYEVDLKLRDPLDPGLAVAGTDHYTEAATIATVETTEMAYEFVGQLEVRARRQMPPNLNVALNLNLQLPPGLQPDQLPAELQALLQQVQQALLQHAQVAVQQALAAQAPLVGLDVGLRGGRWNRSA
ncbi:MAG: hypothetical protein HYX34_02655 [Actinobacteria bacterium]|nr:hypothetical protein [Actinomycetota bacterium]